MSDSLRWGVGVVLLAIGVLLVLLILSTTIPAQVPIQIEQAQPNPPLNTITVTDNLVQISDSGAGTFQFMTPANWRVVKTSEATQPVQVVLVAPDDEYTITVDIVQSSDGITIPLHSGWFARFREEGDVGVYSTVLDELVRSIQLRG